MRGDGRKRGGGGHGRHQRWREAGAARLGVGRRWRGGDGAVRREGEQATANGVERRGHRLPSGQTRGSSWRWSGRHGQGRRGSPGSSRERGEEWRKERHPARGRGVLWAAAALDGAGASSPIQIHTGSGEGGGSGERGGVGGVRAGGLGLLGGSGLIVQGSGRLGRHVGWPTGLAGSRPSGEKGGWGQGLLSLSHLLFSFSFF